MNKLPVSVYIICQNESKHIQRVLKNVEDFDEVIIVDSGSTDDTLEIAKEFTENIYYQPWLGFAKQKEYAKSLCTNEWVLNLDADEEITQTLKEEIKKAIEENSIDALDIRRNCKYLDKFDHPWLKFNRRIRFFRKSKGFYPPKLVHESIVVKGKIKKAKGFILDHGTFDLETHLHKINEYSSLRAEEKSKQKRKASLLKLLTIFPVAFLKSYILKRGFFNGIRGFIAGINNAYYAFLKEAKLYEKNSIKKF